MGIYNDGNSKDQLNKLIKRKTNTYMEERKNLNFFDLVGTLSGVIVGGVAIGLLGHPFIGSIVGGLVGYFMTPHFVPKFFRWIKKK